MILNIIFDIFFGLLDFVFGFLPDYKIEALATNTLQIFGYGVYILGEVFFNVFISIIIAEITLSITFNLMRFGVNVARGSGA